MDDEELEYLTIEELLRDIDVSGSPGLFWYVVGAGVTLFLFAATSVWRLSCRLRGIK